MFSRDGSFNIFRVGLIAGGLGVLVIVLGIIAFSIDQASYRAALEIAPFPGAGQCGQQDFSRVQRRTIYCVPGGNIEAIKDYYQALLDQHYGQDANTPQSDRFTCERIDTFETTSEVPYYYTCLFDRSGFNATHYTQIIIQPGVTPETQGQIVIAHDATWMP